MSSFFLKILQAQGKYQNQPPLPFILGTEFAGEISLDSPIPEGCALKRGQRVFGAAQGAFADKVAVDFERLIPLPDSITFDQGAGITCSILLSRSPIRSLWQAYM